MGKNRKTTGADGTLAVMLKYGGETVIQWMHRICELACKKGEGAPKIAIQKGFQERNPFVYWGVTVVEEKEGLGVGGKGYGVGNVQE